MAARKKAVSKKAAGSSRKKASSKAAGKKPSSKTTAAISKVGKKPQAKKSAKKSAAPSRKKVATPKVSKKKAPQKTASRKTVAKKAAKGKSAKKTATRTATKGASKKVSNKKVTAKSLSNKKTAPATGAASSKGSAKASKSAPAPAVKRKIAISMPVVKRPARISSMAPINPVDLFPSRPRRRRKPADDQSIHGIAPYQLKKDELYMSDTQLEHFRKILTAWKAELMQEVDRTVHHMQDEASNFPDPNDRATQESEFGLELRTRDRERKLLKKIDQALGRVDDGSYGYCEETGDEIGLKRLEARPVATLSVESQERREVAERLYRDPDDR
jgi:DnaK suppressor protein